MPRAITRLTDWPVGWAIRRNGLPDTPEVRRALHAYWTRLWTLGITPSRHQMHALNQQAAAAIRRARQPPAST